MHTQSRAGFTGVLFSLCCALAPALVGGCSSTVNQDACRSYVAHLNDLDCREREVDAGETCPENLDSSGSTSCVDFYECLTEAATCDGDTFINDVGACTSCAIKE